MMEEGAINPCIARPESAHSLNSLPPLPNNGFDARAELQRARITLNGKQEPHHPVLEFSKIPGYTRGNFSVVAGKTKSIYASQAHIQNYYDFQLYLFNKKVGYIKTMNSLLPEMIKNE